MKLKYQPGHTCTMAVSSTCSIIYVLNNRLNEGHGKKVFRLTEVSVSSNMKGAKASYYDFPLINHSSIALSRQDTVSLIYIDLINEEHQ
jgi:hypothetical protein